MRARVVSCHMLVVPSSLAMLQSRDDPILSYYYPFVVFLGVREISRQYVAYSPHSVSAKPDIVDS